MWKSSFHNKKKKDNLRWAVLKIDRLLVQGLEGKLDKEERKSLRQQLLLHEFDVKRESATRELEVVVNFQYSTAYSYYLLNDRK